MLLPLLRPLSWHRHISRGRRLGHGLLVQARFLPDSDSGRAASHWADSYPPVPLYFHHLSHPEGGVGLGVGRQRRPPLVIHHGMLGSSRNWLSLGRILQRKLATDVYVIDARNHGLSPHHPDLSYRHLASDLRHFLAEQDLAEVTLLGHSLGARAAMLLCLLEAGGAQKRLVGNLVSVDASPIHPTTPGGQRAMNTFLKALTDVDFDAIPTTFKFSEAKTFVDAQLASGGVMDASMRQWLLMNLLQDPLTGRCSWQFNPSSFRANFESHLLLMPDRPEWTLFPGRTLFLCSGQSNYVPRDCHDEIRAAAFPAARFQYVEGAGHWVQADKPCVGYLARLTRSESYQHFFKTELLLLSNMFI